MIFNIRKGEFCKFNKTSQITTLPGTKHREASDIVDDSRIPVKKSIAYQEKLSRDFNSSVSCLRPLINKGQTVSF